MKTTNVKCEPVFIQEGEYMSALYPEGLPSNAIIDKTLTGKGATTCELDERYAKRHSIIIEPNVPVVRGKQNKYPEVLCVSEGVEDRDILEYLQNESIRYKKIMVTPESYLKVKRAAGYANVNLFKDFFLLIDECEKTVQDADFRPNIILPFFDFFSFENKAIISATPLFPNLSGFTRQEFRYIKIVPTYDYKKDLSLIATNNVQVEFIEQASANDNKKAVFVNSIDYAKALIKKADIRDCSKIYCSNSKEAIRDLRRAGYKASDNFEPNETLEQYSFFTSRFYSAVDLESPDTPDIIMVTDCLSKKQTMIDPFTHAIQIVGRFRSGIGRITHITNWDSSLRFQSRDEIIEEVMAGKVFYDKLSIIKETLIGRQRELLREIEERSPVFRFLFQNDHYKGKINPFLLECYIQKSKVASLYQNIRTLEKAYQDSEHFNVSYQYKSHKEKVKEVKPKALSRKRKLEILERLQELKPERMVLKFLTDEEEEELASLFREALELCQYYMKFGINKIIEINYDLAIMKRQLKTAHRGEIFLAPIDEIYDTFTIGEIYPEIIIVDRLQEIYDKYELVDDNGNRLIAKAAYLQKYYDPCERVSVPNSKLKGYIPIKMRYSL